MTKVVAIGECMLELSALDDRRGWRLAHAGDTYNTALYLSRLGLKTSFMSALGADRFSAEMLQSWRDEGLDVSLVLTAPDHIPGIYAITTDSFGERSFAYWRSESAARQMFTLPAAEGALNSASEADLIYVSGITLSLFDEAGRAKLGALAARVRDRGGTVAFDPNYRARLWPSQREARAAINAFARHVTITLPTFEDEQTLFGDESAMDTAIRWQRYGAEEIIVKVGPKGCLVFLDRELRAVAPENAVTAIDTTGAGDSFNAGYLFARNRGQSIIGAARFGNQLAGTVIQHPGAIIARDEMPMFRLGD